MSHHVGESKKPDVGYNLKLLGANFERTVDHGSTNNANIETFVTKDGAVGLRNRKDLTFFQDKHVRYEVFASQMNGDMMVLTNVSMVCFLSSDDAEVQTRTSLFPVKEEGGILTEFIANFPWGRGSMKWISSNSSWQVFLVRRERRVRARRLVFFTKLCARVSPLARTLAGARLSLRSRVSSMSCRAT